MARRSAPHQRDLPTELAWAEADHAGFAEHLRLLEAAFGGLTEDLDQQVEHERTMYEPDRWLMVREQPGWPAAGSGGVHRGQVVAGAGAYSFELTVPGGAVLPAAGVTWVVVSPARRRQGLLRSMMARQLDDVARRGEAVAVLTASEGSIYGRFGYGAATCTRSMVVPVARASFARPVATPGQLSVVDPASEEVRSAQEAVYDRFRQAQPGALARSAAYWAFRRASPNFERPPGAGTPELALHHDGQGHVDGYASWRSAPDGTTHLREVVALDPVVDQALWQLVLSLDLRRELRCEHLPVDHPLPWWLTDGRCVATTAVRDHLWLRLVDVAAALSARGYEADGEVVLEVVDGFRPDGAAAGRFLLEVVEGRGRCRRLAADEPLVDVAQVRVEVSTLGAAYLGGTRMATLARAGLVEGSAEAVAVADRLLATVHLPFCNTPF